MATLGLQEELEARGCVVVSTPLCDPERLKEVREAFDGHLKTSPELKDPKPGDGTWTPIKGGFAACGHPSSFHHPFVRRMRERVMALLLQGHIFPLRGKKLEQVFDRILYRIPGQSFSGEGEHRDNSPHARPGDVVFGSFLNLDDEPQFFECAPGTHTETSENYGFATIKDRTELDRLAPLFERVEVPPGCLVVFYERLVHKVAKSRATHIMRRMFFGWRITEQSESLFGGDQTLAWVEEQAVPKIKSDQLPVVFPSCYANFPRHFDELSEWSRETFVEACLYPHTVKSGKRLGECAQRVKANMHSLKKYGLDLHPAYDDDEKRILTPGSAWNLFTFDDDTKRRRFTAPGQES